MYAYQTHHHSHHFLNLLIFNVLHYFILILRLVYLIYPIRSNPLPTSFIFYLHLDPLWFHLIRFSSFLFQFLPIFIEFNFYWMKWNEIVVGKIIFLFLFHHFLGSNCCFMSSSCLIGSWSSFSCLHSFNLNFNFNFNWMRLNKWKNRGYFWW